MAVASNARNAPAVPDLDTGRPRLLVVSSYFDSHLGGLELVAGRLARELADMGFPVTWAATDASPLPEDRRLRTIALPASNVVEHKVGLPLPVPFPKAWAAIHRAVASNDVVLIHDTLYFTSMAALISAKLLGKPTIVLQHIGDALFESRMVQAAARAAERLISRTCLGQADQVVYVSDTVRNHFARVRLRRPPLVSLSGIDTAAFHPPRSAADKAGLRAGFGFSADRPVALYAGRFVGKKGVDYLRTVAELCPDIDIVLAGAGPVDPNGWGLSNVRDLGSQSSASLADLYRAADAFILPSPSEGFSLVIREALASGLPVVCGEQAAQTDPQSARYLHAVPLSIGDPAGNALRLSKALRRALEAQPSPRQAEFARRRYDWRRIAMLFRGVVEELDRGGQGVRMSGAAA